MDKVLLEDYTVVGGLSLLVDPTDVADSPSATNGVYCINDGADTLLKVDIRNVTSMFID